jgi:hypothetical protein
MVYVIQVCRQLSSSRIRMELHPGFIIRKSVTMYGHMNEKLVLYCSCYIQFGLHVPGHNLQRY